MSDKSDNSFHITDINLNRLIYMLSLTPGFAYPLLLFLLLHFAGAFFYALFLFVYNFSNSFYFFQYRQVVFS